MRQFPSTCPLRQNNFPSRLISAFLQSVEAPGCTGGRQGKGTPEQRWAQTGRRPWCSSSVLALQAVDYSYGMSALPAAAVTQTHKMQCKYK